MKLKKVKLVFFTLLIGVLSLAGCGNNTSPSSTEAGSQEEIIRSFIEAINEKNSAAAEAMLAPSVAYIENYADGSQFKEERIEEIKLIIKEIIENNTQETITMMQNVGENTWEVQGQDKDFLTEILGFNDGLSYQSTYILQDGKIRSVEITWDSEEKVIEQKIEGIIGIQLDLNSDKVKIKELAEGMPAEKAGLEAGDLIEAVDGFKVTDMKYGIKEAFYRIRGPVGSKVKLTVNREGNIFEVEVDRVTQVKP